MLLIHGIVALSNLSAAALILPQMIGAVLGLFIIVGFWTPLAGGLIVVMQIWTAWTGAGNELSFVLAILGGTLAMIGPGAWSIDARLFGRKHLVT